MATFVNRYKYALKYTASITGESTARTLSGLNISTTGSSIGTDGASKAQGTTALVNTLISFTTGTLSNFAYVVEQEVQP